MLSDNHISEIVNTDINEKIYCVKQISKDLFLHFNESNSTENRLDIFGEMLLLTSAVPPVS